MPEVGPRNSEETAGLSGAARVPTTRVDPVFDADYFESGFDTPYARNEKWLSLAGAFATAIASRIVPRTVLDAGCSMGLLVEKLREQGIEAYGVDVSEFAIERADQSIREYVRVGSIVDPFPQRYDLIVTIEVLEHLPAGLAEAAVANLCAYTDDILFSSTPDGYFEATHANAQPPGYWGELFARQGLIRDVDFDASFISPWAVRFRRRSDPTPRLIGEYERRFGQLWRENTDLRRTVLQQTAEVVAGRRQAVELAQAQLALAQARSELTQAQSELAQAQSDLAQASAEGSRLRGRVEDLLAEDERSQGVIATLRADLAARTAERDQRQQHAENLEAALQSVQRTRAWRVLGTLHRLRPRLPGRRSRGAAPPDTKEQRS